MPSQPGKDGLAAALAEKFRDFRIDPIRLFVVHEVPGVRHDVDPDVAEVVRKPVAPGGTEDWVAFAPQHARRDIDGRQRRRAVADQLETWCVHGLVTVEAALQIAGLQEVVDPGFEILVEYPWVV